MLWLCAGLPGVCERWRICLCGAGSSVVGCSTTSTSISSALVIGSTPRMENGLCEVF